MPLTTEQRRQINRRNANKSTGPKTEEGKARSRLNALKHGLRSEVFALPNEDPGACQALADEWHDYYQPDSPGECALVDRAVHATIQLRRCARFQAEAVGQRVREAEELWDWEKEKDLALFDGLLWGDDPARAVSSLKCSAAGCALLLDDWSALLDVLDRDGRWEPADRDRALRLCGQNPDTTETTPLAYLLRFYNLFTLANPRPELVESLLDPKRVPPSLRGTFGAARPTPEESREALRELVEHEVGALHTRHARMELLDGADRAGAADRALLLDGPEGALLLRYETMHDRAFHRAYSALLKRRKDDARAETDRLAATGGEPDAPNEPKPRVEDEPRPAVEAAAPNEPKPGVEAVAPNEPKPAAPVDSKAAPREVSDDAMRRDAAVSRFGLERMPVGVRAGAG